MFKKDFIFLILLVLQHLFSPSVCLSVLMSHPLASQYIQCVGALYKGSASVTYSMDVTMPRRFVVAFQAGGKCMGEKLPGRNWRCFIFSAQETLFPRTLALNCFAIYTVVSNVNLCLDYVQRLVFLSEWKATALESVVVRVDGGHAELRPLTPKCIQSPVCNLVWQYEHVGLG